MSQFPLHVFDAYGTLFDVHSAVARHSDAIGPQARQLSQLWRTKQLEYSWVLSLMGEYRDFWDLTQDALDFAAASCGGVSMAVRADLMAAYLTLAAYPDALPCLQRLKASGAKTAILSNGSPAMLAAAVKSAGLTGVLDACLSVETVKIFKTAPAAYALVDAHFGRTAHQVCFHSSNRWDIAGARRFGFHAVWINRTASPEEYAGFAPHRVVVGLDAILPK